MPRLVGGGRKLGLGGKPGERRGRIEAERHDQQRCQCGGAGEKFPPVGAVGTEPLEFISGDQQVEENQSHQVAEEQRDHADDRQRRDTPRRALPPRDPGGGEQQGDAEGGDKVQKTEQQRGIVGNQAGCQRPDGSRAERRPAVGERADHRHQQRAPHHHPSGEMDRQYAQQRRQQQIGAKIGNHRPVRRVHARQERVGAAGCQHHRARQMVRIVEQRRHIDQRQRRQQDRAQQDRAKQEKRPVHVGP